MTKSKSWRDVLKIHPAAELFPLMSPDEAAGARRGYQEERAHEPDRHHHPQGRQRLELPIYSTAATGSTPWSLLASPFKVARENGHCWLESADLDPPIFPGAIIEDRNPYAYAISANIYRRHLTAEQKRELIAKVLKVQPEKSNRTIARQTKADDKTVGKVRRELEGRAEIPHVDAVEDTKGRKQLARRTSTNTPQVSQEVLQQRAAAAERIRELMGGKTRGDIGPTSNGEAARLQARVDELLAEKRRLEIENIGLRSEIEELKARLAAPPDDSFGIPPFLRRAAP
jgi:hypothetical protein